jgi:hypothetical protein
VTRKRMVIKALFPSYITFTGESHGLLFMFTYIQWTNNDLLIHVCIFNIIFNLLFVSLFEKDKINIESLFLTIYFQPHSNVSMDLIQICRKNMS